MQQCNTANKRGQCDACISHAERKQSRPKVNELQNREAKPPDYFDKVFNDLKDLKDFKDFRDLIHLQRYFFLSKVRHLFTVSRVT